MSEWFCSSITQTINGLDSNRRPHLDVWLVLVVGRGVGLISHRVLCLLVGKKMTKSDTAFAKRNDKICSISIADE